MLVNNYRKGFTLLEILISIILLGIVIVTLFSTVTMMKDSNEQLHNYLLKAKNITDVTKVLYSDIIGSDGNLSIKTDEFAQLCIEATNNSLYGLPVAKVCWVVLKKENILVRIEGNNYHLPTRAEERVEINPIIKSVELFDIYHEKDKVLVFIKEKGKTSISFMIQGINKPILKKKKPKKKPTKGRVQTSGKPISGKGGQPPTLKAGEIPPK